MSEKYVSTMSYHKGRSTICSMCGREVKDFNGHGVCRECHNAIGRSTKALKHARV